MPEACDHSAPTRKTRKTPCRPWPASKTTVWVTVLLLHPAWLCPAKAGNYARDDFRVFQFTCDIQTPGALGRIDGRMASNGERFRIAIYWIEPDSLRENSLFRESDVIVKEGRAHYWTREMLRPETLRFPEDPCAPPAIEPGGAEAILRAALAVASRVRRRPEDAGIPLEAARFFQACRGRPAHTLEAAPGEADGNDLSGDGETSIESFDAMPYGRTYSKRTQPDGEVVWQARRTLNDRPVVTVAVEPLPGVGLDDRADAFDVDTLGRWTLVPKPYRTYWSFAAEYSEIAGAQDAGDRGRELYDEIASCLTDSNAPAPVRGAMIRLHLQAALLTGDADRVRRSLKETVDELCRRDATPPYQALLELGKISERIDERYPGQAQEWLRPLVAQMVKHAGPDAVANMRKLTLTIQSNKWFTYGRLLLEEIRTQGLEKESVLDAMTAQLDAFRMATVKEPPDPCESCETVARYVAGLDVPPPKGDVDMNDLRQILEEGLAGPDSQDRSEVRDRFVEDVLRAIRLTVGDGPFCADRERLIDSIARFRQNHPVAGGDSESAGTVLATFLALSFCDISTPADHEVLLSQFRRQSDDIRSQVAAMLKKRSLDPLVTEAELESTFDLYERIFRRCLDDPLWPAFKFPLTRNERTRLTGRLRPRLAQFEASLDKISLNVQYGGINDQLKKSLVREISLAVQQLLPEMAFLRNPPYPGVTCSYRGGRGFTVILPKMLYQEGGRPGDRFNAMKYFHLGHRLQELVERERELARLALSDASRPATD